MPLSLCPSPPRPKHRLFVSNKSLKKKKVYKWRSRNSSVDSAAQNELLVRKIYICERTPTEMKRSRKIACKSSFLRTQDTQKLIQCEGWPLPTRGKEQLNNLNWDWDLGKRPTRPPKSKSPKSRPGKKGHQNQGQQTWSQWERHNLKSSHYTVRVVVGSNSVFRVKSTKIRYSSGRC